jgi:hypothetical protein
MSKGTPLWTFQKKKLSYIFFYISRLISGLRVEWANKSFFEIFFWTPFKKKKKKKMTGITFVGCLNLRLEIPKSLQKESAQTDHPRLRNHPKTVSVPPLGGDRLVLRGGNNLFLWVEMISTWTYPKIMISAPYPQVRSDKPPKPLRNHPKPARNHPETTGLWVLGSLDIIPCLKSQKKRVA